MIGLLRRPARDVPYPLAPGTSVLTASGVDVDIGARRILSGVNLALRAGEVLVLVGPNGAGKSSLLAVLAGDRAPANGRIMLNGVELSLWRPGEIAMRRAVMPQQVTVAFPFTVRDVTAMGRAPWSGTIDEDDNESLVRQAMRDADVVELADRTVTSLSGGEQARVAFARVLAQATNIMLLDEPTASLDLHHQQLVMQIVRRRTREGAAAVVVVHDLNLAAAYADRIAVLAGGRLAAVGPPAAVLTSELVSDVYGYAVDVLPHPHTGAPLVLPRTP